MKTPLILSVILAFAGAAPAAKPGFSKTPVATRDGDKVKITFAVSAPTDVAVYIEDAAGRIVRHLAAGALGKNAPEPLKANSLEQSIEWDGKDDDGVPAFAQGAATGTQVSGVSVQAGTDSSLKPEPRTLNAFRVRVGLGLKANWGGTAFAEPDNVGPNRIERIGGLACGPDGRLYVLDFCDAWVFGNSSKVLVLRRDGSYEKTIKPFPPTLPLDRVKPVGAFVNSFGVVNPVIFSMKSMNFYPQKEMTQQPAVTPDGRIVLAGITLNLYSPGEPTLAMIDSDGGIPNATYAGPVLAKAFWRFPWSASNPAAPCLASAPDGKAVYFTGLGSSGGDKNVKAWPAVYLAKLPDRGPLEVFFGDPKQAGNDSTHLNDDPRGVAVDGRGHVLVADVGNNRVVVINEKDKSFAGTFPVEQPSWVAVHPRTGAVYVCSKQTVVVKFSGWQNAKEQARADLSDFLASRLKKVQRAYHWGTSLCFALDGSAEPAVLWAGLVTNKDAARQAGGAQLLVRCEDRGTAFGDIVPAGCGGAPLFRRPASDPTHREIACLREGYLYILDEETGKIRVGGKPARGSCTASSAANPGLDRDGNIYVSSHESGLMRYNPDGQPLPFPASAPLPFLQGRLPAGATGTTWWESAFCVDRKGDIYVRKDGLNYHGQMCLQVYDRDGNFKRMALWTVSDGMYGPRVDSKGNIYIMDIAKPVGQPFPAEFKEHVVLNPDPRDVYFGPSAPDRPTSSLYHWIYGSIVKFGPEGGAMWMGSAERGPSHVSYEGWRGNNVPDLRTTGGALTGTVANPDAQRIPWLVFPTLNLDTTTQNTITLRMKNATDGNQAVLGYSKEGPYGGYYPQAACQVELGRSRKVIEIKPNSDFAEYTFDMSGEKDWKGKIHWLTLSPSNGKQGTFSIDWIRIGAAAGKLEWNFDKEDSQDKKLPAALKKEKAIAYHCPDGIELQGAVWMRPGFSPGYACTAGMCHCTGTDFDVDDFGRVFAPDLGRFRVGVLDSNGNELMSFGAYGNQDFCGPDSYVIDPVTKLLRPRKDGDPKEQVSPFAQPEIAFAWIVGLAVTDKHGYVADAINKRVLRVKLGYAAESICEIK